MRGDDGEIKVFAEIPNPSGDPGSDGLGDLDFAADGSLFVPRFGFGMQGLGAIFRVSADGTATELPGVASEWRRVGLDYDDTRGLLYVATYSRDADDVYTGWISTVDPVAGVVTKYAAADPLTPVAFAAGSVADAEPAVPGWTLAVDALFA